MALATTATTALAIAKHTPADAYIRAKLQADSKHGLELLQHGVTNYLNATRDSNGNLVYPGDNVDLGQLISPRYGFLPQKLSKSYDWVIKTSSASGQPSVSICLKLVGTQTRIEGEVLGDVQKMHKNTFMGNTCDSASTGQTGGNLVKWMPLSEIPKKASSVPTDQGTTTTPTDTSGQGGTPPPAPQPTPAPAPENTSTSQQTTVSVTTNNTSTTATVTTSGTGLLQTVINIIKKLF